MTVLPDKPSELIRVALADLEKCEASPDYVIDMGVYHAPIATSTGFDERTPEKPDAVCVVCFAGAVMANSLGCKRADELEPCDFAEADARKLRAIDELRVGNVVRALDELGIEGDHELDDIIPVRYDVNPGVFKAQMRKLADDLEGAGL